MKRILYITIFVLCAAACGQSAPQGESASAEYETMTVSRSDISLEETYPASIEGRQSIRIIPRVEGYLQEIKVKEGQRVKKDQVLFILDQANYVADEKAARANVEVAKAGVETAQLNYDSRKGLREKNIVSEYDLQTAAAALSLAKAQLQQAEAQSQPQAVQRPVPRQQEANRHHAGIQIQESVEQRSDHPSFPPSPYSSSTCRAISMSRRSL